MGTGWAGLLNELVAVDMELKQLPYYYGIVNIHHHNGMLRVVFGPTEEQLQHETISLGIQFITNAVAYRIERLSAKICEDCGQYGNRRTELPTTQTLCTRCFALKYSEFKDSQV